MTKMLALTPAEMETALGSACSSIRSSSRGTFELADPEAPTPEFSRAHLERAKERLAGIDAVGLQERYEEFCDELSARFGWDLGEPERVQRHRAGRSLGGPPRPDRRGQRVRRRAV